MLLASLRLSHRRHCHISLDAALASWGRVDTDGAVATASSYHSSLYAALAPWGRVGIALDIVRPYMAYVLLDCAWAPYSGCLV